MARHNINLRTYGRHKQRTIHIDIWSSEEKDKNVFSSTSSSASSDSTLNYTKEISVGDKSTRNSDIFINVDDQARTETLRNARYGKENIKRRAGLRHTVDVNYFPTSESELTEGSSRGNRGTSTRVTHRALRNKIVFPNPQTLNDYNTLENKKISNREVTKKKKNSPIPNFSEFENYSLIITVDSPIQTKHFIGSNKHFDSNFSGKRKRCGNSRTECNTSITKGTLPVHLLCDESRLVENVDPPSLKEHGHKHLQVETSTPFAKKTCKSIVDISHIEPIDYIPECFQSTNKSNHSSFDQSNHSIQNVNSSVNVVSSPLIFESKFVDQQPQKNPSVNYVEDVNSQSSAQCLDQLDRLKESFLMMHINDRKSRPSKQPLHTQRAISFDSSESLFNSFEMNLDAPSTSHLDIENSVLETSTNSQITSESDSSDKSDDSIDDTDEFEIENLSEIREDEECEQTKYELNENYEGDWIDSEKTESNSDTSSDNSSKSIYCTAESESDSCNPSMDESSFNTALRSPVNSCDFHQSSKCKSSVWSEKINHQKDILSLEKSFRIILTPIKVNCKQVPQSPQTKVLDVCVQSKPLPFTCCILDDMMAKCVKIGEGVYGEVFRTHNSGSVALKIIPIEGDFTVNDEPQKTYEEILPEIVISKELSSLRYNAACRTANFCEVKRVCCVQGKYPPKLLQEWDVFHKQKQSENDRPSMFGAEQLYIMLEFADGGKDLESCNFHSISQAHNVITQVVYSLAVAEEALQFEHRDLHWGNVLVRKTDKKRITYNLFGNTLDIDSGKLEVSIIDFTLSRLGKDGCTVFCDLATDESLFQGEGDYQFDIYRKMQEENGNKWEPFNPHTNVMWIHYLADKLVRAKRYSSNTRNDKNVLRDFRQFLKDVLLYSSACELVTCSFINSSAH